MVHHRNYKIREEAKVDITKYIEPFYNQQRIQKGLNFKTPNQMAEDFYKLAALESPKWKPLINSAHIKMTISGMLVRDIH